MATKAQIRTGVKTKITRSPSGIDTKIDEYIGMAVELFSSTLSAVHDDREYDYTVNSDDVAANVESYEVPSGLKTIWDLTWVDTSGNEDTFYPIQLVSPVDLYNARKHGLGHSTSEQVAAGGRFDLAVDTNTFVMGGGRRSGRATRSNQTGRPQMACRLGDKIFVYPRPGTTEVDNKIRLFAAMKAEVLTSDSDTNTITNNYPETLEAYVAALTEYYVFKDYPAGDKWLQQASLMLTSFATQDEINQLVNIPLSFSRS